MSTTAYLLVQVICVLATVRIAGALPRLVVEYPEPGSYNVVTLTCRNSFGDLLNNAVFKKRVPGQSQATTLPGTGEISIALTQEGEGYFSCLGAVEDGTSEEIGLAAEPAIDYDGTERHRYITFPTADSSRNVTLICPIRPGSLSDRYSVRWETSIPGIPGFILEDTEHYDLTEDIGLDSRRQYQCKVTIQHNNGDDETYDGPMIILEKRLLASVVDIQNVSVLKGEMVTFTCEFRSESDIVIDWRLDGDLYECGSRVAPDDSGCYTNDTHSVLVLRDTSSLAIGSHPVQCILQQNIPDDFKNDPSFRDCFNNITRNASLTIRTEEPQLDVQYPDVNNHSVVKLTCQRETLPQNDAEFLKDGTPLLTTGSESHQVTIVNNGSGEITFSFTQEQEGYFSCHSGGHSSDEIGLAADPTVDEKLKCRYITFPSPDSVREITLTCPIRPGRLSGQYWVEWTSRYEGSEKFTVINRKDYSIKEDIDPSSPQYQCTVTVQHRSDQEDTTVYNNTITIEQLVLATVENEIENMSISRGESAEFKCSFLKRNGLDIDVNWHVGDILFDKCASTEKDVHEDNGCYTTETESVLLLKNTSSFAIRSYPVQCVLHQNVSDNFKNDPSFSSDFNTIIRSSYLILENKYDESSSPVSRALLIIISVPILLLIIIIAIAILCLCKRREKHCQVQLHSEDHIYDMPQYVLKTSNSATGDDDITHMKSNVAYGSDGHIKYMKSNVAYGVIM